MEGSCELGYATANTAKAARIPQINDSVLALLNQWREATVVKLAYDKYGEPERAKVRYKNWLGFMVEDWAWLHDLKFLDQEQSNGG